MTQIIKWREWLITRNSRYIERSAISSSVRNCVGAPWSGKCSHGRVQPHAIDEEGKAVNSDEE
jgi:hypothetical protein